MQGWREWMQANRAVAPYLFACLALVVVGLLASVFVLAGGPAAWAVALILLLAIVAGAVLLSLIDRVAGRTRRGGPGTR
jgi:uncharacterized membrane protein YdjX (TVP38/TMEM64 family)